MKFQNAWANLAKENLTLKLVLICTSLVALGSIAVAAHESMKDAVVIDRGCSTAPVKPGDNTRDENEIKRFLKEAITQRFDSGVTPSENFITDSEIQSKTIEQKELSSRSMEQVTIFRGATIQGETATVQADRIIGVGDIKSVFSLSVVVNLMSTARTYENPYGLKVIRFQQQKKEEKKQ